MRLSHAILAAGLFAVPAAAQPFLVPLTPQRQEEPPPPPPPSPVPVAPPQANTEPGPGDTQQSGPAPQEAPIPGDEASPPASRPMQR